MWPRGNRLGQQDDDLFSGQQDDLFSGHLLAVRESYENVSYDVRKALQNVTWFLSVYYAQAIVWLQATTNYNPL